MNIPNYMKKYFCKKCLFKKKTVLFETKNLFEMISHIKKNHYKELLGNGYHYKNFYILIAEQEVKK